MSLGDFHGVGGPSSQNRGTSFQGPRAYFVDGFGGYQRPGTIMDMDKPQVAFAALQGGEHRVLAGFSAGDEIDRGRAKRMGFEHRFNFRQLQLVAIGDYDATDESGAEKSLQGMK